MQVFFVVSSKSPKIFFYDFQIILFKDPAQRIFNNYKGNNPANPFNIFSIYINTDFGISSFYYCSFEFTLL